MRDIAEKSTPTHMEQRWRLTKKLIRNIREFVHLWCSEDVNVEGDRLGSGKGCRC